MKFLAKYAVLLPLLVVACSAETSDDPAGSKQVDDRAPIGKADSTGSCQGPSESRCGGKSDGNCWCDSKCETFGDCCSDKAKVCDGATGCVGGKVVETAAFSDSTDGKERVGSVAHCVTDDGFACPQLSPLPPDFCKDGTAVKGADSFVPSSDGKACQMPSVHCVTKDGFACPQLSPLPPNFCKDGKAVKGASSFIPSADGMECELPSVHCVTNDANACTPPAFCADGTLVTETEFASAGSGFECTKAKQHCVTKDSSGCPQLSPLPPGFCKDGDVVVGPPKYLAAAGGMECQMPSVHCVTRDAGACPQFSPLPPDYAANRYGAHPQGVGHWCRREPY